MNNASFAALFPLGAHLCREPMPAMSEMKRDLELLKRHGFNLVKLQEHWMIDEPEEGRCNFSRYEELIAHAATLDLGVYLGLTCEQAPHWLYEKHPGCRMVRHDGSVVSYEAQTTLPSDGKPGPCYDHPGALADQLRFIRRLVEALGRFENVVVWNTWQEIGYWAEGLVGGHVCYCPNTLSAYRAWLQERHGDLDALNRAWKSRYRRWEDIVPERGARPLVCAQEMTWRFFMDQVQVAGVLRRRAEAIRAADPRKRPIFAHKGGPAFASGQDWVYARCQDFLGTSCYPAWGCGHGWDDGHRRPFVREHALLTELWDGVIHRFDHIRSANPGKGRAGAPVWAAEFQGGPVSTGFHLGRVPSADDIRRWMLAAASAGVTAISFWVARAEIMAGEPNGFGLLNSAGESTSRLEEAGRVGRALHAHADLLAQPTFQPARVGLLVNEENHRLCSLLNQGGEHLAYSLRGWHRLLWETNFPLDLVDLDHDADHLRDYAVLVLPFPLCLSEAKAGVLTGWVDAGGCLVSEAAPGRIDENGFCNRGELSPVLAALFGVRQAGFAMVREPDGGARWSPAERTWGEYLEALTLEGTGPLTGHRLRANVYLETFECGAEAEPVLKAGDAVAGVRRAVGQGQAWLLGTYVGHQGTAYRDPVHVVAVKAIVNAGGVAPEHEGRLICRRRVGKTKEIRFYVNPFERALCETVSVAGFDRVSGLLGETVERGGDAVRLTVEGLDVRALVLER